MNRLFTDPEPIPESFASRGHSLATLLRVVSLICLLLGWFSLIHGQSPEVVLVLITAAGTVLAIIVAWRRHGTLTNKAAVAVTFYTGVVVVAGYSACLAETAVPRFTADPSDYWSRLPNLVLWLFSPVILVVILLMFRAWTWSAHDHSIHPGH